MPARLSVTWQLLLADENVIDYRSHCLYISVKQLILAQWETLSCYKWGSWNVWLYGIFNYFLLYCRQLIKAGAALLFVRRHLLLFLF